MLNHLPMKLQKLDLNAFRGATQPFSLDFDPAKRITMIFGENGTGKSSIADALICLCTADHGSLDDKSGADKNYLVAAGHQPSELLVSLLTDQGRFSAGFASKKIVGRQSAPPPPLRHLRRSSVIELATAPPAKRFEQLAAYFDLSGIIKSENALRDLVRNVGREMESIVRTLVAVENILDVTWKNEGSPLSSWEAWARHELRKDLSAEQHKLSDIRAAIEAWNRAKIAQEKLLATQEEGRKAAEHRAETEQQLDAQHAVADHGPALLPLLETAQTYLSGDHPDPHSCPLCQQVAEHSYLLTTTQVRLQQMTTLREASLAAQAARTEHERLQTLWRGNLETLHTDILQCTAALSKLENTPALQITIEELQKPELLPQKRTDHFLASFQALEQFLLGKTAQADSISKALDQHGLIRENWKAVLQNRAAAEKTTALQTAAEAALKVVESARKAYIEAELLAVSTEVDTLYQLLHPQENIGDVRLFLKEKGRNSLELTASFHGHTDITPQSLYSESHLDTLALCIFFALAKRYGTPRTILLLDDVLSACDENHLDRFIQLLHDQAQHFAHIFITTHYRPWRDRYRQQRAPQNEIHLIELLPWTPQRGIRCQNGRNDLQELRQALSDGAHFDRQSIANKAGTLLENMLENLALRYGRPLPYRARREYALRELLDCFSAKLSAALRVEHFSRDASGKVDTATPVQTHALQPLLEALKKLTAVRNQVGSHFNFDGSMISDTDVRNFGEAVLALADCLICPESGGFPDRDKSGSWLETRSGLVRLHPLQAPS